MSYGLAGEILTYSIQEVLNMAKMRTTTRGGRQGKPKHNDRTYLPPEERPRENRYSYVGQKSAPNLTFKEAELRYHEKRLRRSGSHEH